MSICMRLYLVILLSTGALFSAEPRSTWLKTGDGHVTKVDNDIAESLTTLANSAEFGSSTRRDPLELEPISKQDLDTLIAMMRYHKSQNNIQSESFLGSLSNGQLGGVVKAANFLQAPDEVLDLLLKQSALRIMSGTFGDITTIDQLIPRELHRDIMKHVPDVGLNLEKIALRRLNDSHKTIVVKSTTIINPMVQMFDIAMSNDGSLLCASAQRSCVMLSMPDKKIVWQKDYSHYVNAVHFLDNDQKVAVGTEDKMVRLYRARDGAVIKEIKLDSYVTAFATKSVVSHELHMMLNNGWVAKMAPNGSSGYTVHPLVMLNGRGYGLALHPTKSLCLASSLSGFAHLHDWQLKRDLLQLQRMSRVAFNSSGSLFAVGGDVVQKCVVYDTDTRSMIAEFDKVGGVLDVSFSPDDRFICIVALDGPNLDRARMIVADIADKKIVYDVKTKSLLFKSLWHANTLYVGDDVGSIHAFDVPGAGIRTISRSLDLAQIAVVYWLTSNNKSRIKTMTKEYRVVFESLPDELKGLLTRLY